MTETHYFANNNARRFAFNAGSAALPLGGLGALVGLRRRRK